MYLQPIIDRIKKCSYSIVHWLFNRLKNVIWSIAMKENNEIRYVM
jgi:hypothetical protein